MSQFSDRYRGRWRDVLAALGLPARHLTRKNGPCPFCGGKDRWRFVDRRGDGFWVCTNCGTGDGLMLAMRWLKADFPATAKRIEETMGDVMPLPVKALDPAAQRRKLEQVWRDARPFGPTDPAGLYLARRGIKIAPPVSLRQAELPYENQPGPTYPVLIAKVVALDGNGVNIHRTYLTEDGKKADVEKPRKMMAGPIPAGSAVRLAAVDDVVAVCEGIETGLAVQQIFEVPTWATLGTALLHNFEPPPGVRKVLIYADNDASYAGQMAAFTLAHRMVVQRRLLAEVILPPERDTDWNDVLMAAER